jgi:hypothetical protein
MPEPRLYIGIDPSPFTRTKPSGLPPELGSDLRSIPAHAGETVVKPVRVNLWARSIPAHADETIGDAVTALLDPRSIPARAGETRRLC